MDVPEPVTDQLGEESVTARVDLGGGDAVFTTPTRTLLYRSEGILRDESVETFPHDVDRLELSVGRRKVTIGLSTPEDDWEITVPESAEQEVLEAVLEGILGAAGRIEPEEPVRAVYRFSELTLVVTDARLFKHVGNAVWAPDHEELPFADATRVEFEEGTRNSQLVVAVEGRAHRVKLPAADVDAVRRTVEEALFDYHDVDSLEALNAKLTPDEEGESAESFEFEDESGTTDEGGPAEDLRLDVGGEDVEARLAALEEAVEHQTELIEEQQELLERLVDELRRGR
jgi:hypothetical protein